MDPFEYTSGKNISYWVESAPGKTFSSLDQDVKANVVVVGAGIAGITTAYLLCKRGITVVVVEDGSIGSGETGRTTAHLVNALDDRYDDLVKYFGKDGARHAIESHTAAVNKIEHIVREEEIRCDFKRLDGYLFLHPTDKLDSLKEDLKAAQGAGYHSIRMVESVPIASFNSGPALHYPDQAQFHPMHYLNALSERIIKLGGRIFTNTHASSFEKDGIQTSNSFRVTADHVVVATNTPVNDLVSMHTKQAPYRTYVIAARVLKNSIPHLLLWDSGDQTHRPYPYHYVRLQPLDEASDLLIVGGEDHKTGQAEDGSARFQNLENWTREKFPEAGEVLYHWSGQVMEPMDSLAFIGRNPSDENVYICTGDSGNGMTHGTIAGILISDLISGIENPWTEIYNPSRKPLHVVPDFLAENWNVAKQYADWLTKSDIQNLESIQPGHAAVLKTGLHPIAAYREENGTLCASSAVCPHLKCIVHWNAEEKTFDCPCHGSRFTYDGRVVNGPANENLEIIDVFQPSEKDQSSG